MKNYWLNKRSAKKPTITMNSRFLNEARELEGRWAKTGLLDGISKTYSRQVTAVLLEGQRLFNEVATSEEK